VILKSIFRLQASNIKGSIEVPGQTVLLVN
jgi:filamentous hemagglutinin family protein